MKLTKSLEELDAVADELLAKSKAAEKPSQDEDIAPEDIAEDSTPTPESDTEEVDDDEDESEVEDKEVKKSEEPEEVEEPEDEDEGDGLEKCNCVSKSDTLDKSEDPEGDNDPDEGPEDIEKSIKDGFEDSEVISKSINESELFAAVMDVLAKSLGDMQYDVHYNGRQQSAASDVLAKSIQAVIASNSNLRAENEKLSRRLNRLEKSMSQGFDRVMESLDEISAQPVGMRKSMASINVQERDFDSSIHGQHTSGGFESLSKAQVLNVLNNELYSGNPNVTASDIISYESGAPLRNDLQAFVASKCK